MKVDLVTPETSANTATTGRSKVERGPQRGGCQRRWIAIAGGCALLLAVFYFFPLFRIVDLDAAVKEKRSKIFDPRSYAEKFWSNTCPPQRTRPSMSRTWSQRSRVIQKPAKAEHGRTMGLGGIHSFHLRGTGTVVAVGEKADRALSRWRRYDSGRIPDRPDLQQRRARCDRADRGQRLRQFPALQRHLQRAEQTCRGGSPACPSRECCAGCAALVRRLRRTGG